MIEEIKPFKDTVYVMCPKCNRGGKVGTEREDPKNKPTEYIYRIRHREGNPEYCRIRDDDDMAIIQSAVVGKSIDKNSLDEVHVLNMEELKKTDEQKKHLGFDSDAEWIAHITKHEDEQFAKRKTEVKAYATETAPIVEEEKKTKEKPVKEKKVRKGKKEPETCTVCGKLGNKTGPYYVHKEEGKIVERSTRKGEKYMDYPSCHVSAKKTTAVEITA